jgi:hypothetical protein
MNTTNRAPWPIELVGYAIDRLRIAFVWALIVPFYALALTIASGSGTGLFQAPTAWADLAAATASLRTLGTGATQAASGSALAAKMTNPMTTAGDLTVSDTGGAPIRLAKGADGQVLTVDPTTHLLKWVAPTSGGMTNPMTTAGDLILGDTGGAPIRLAKGSDSQTLTVDPSTHLPVWATPGAVGSALLQRSDDGGISLTGSPAIIPWNNAGIDTASAWDATNHRYVVPTTGKYLVSASAAFDNGHTLPTRFGIYINGANSVKVAPFTTPDNFKNAVLTALFALTAGDYVDIRIVNVGYIVADSGFNTLSIVRVG